MSLQQSKFTCVALVMCDRNRLTTFAEQRFPDLKGKPFEQLCVEDEVRAAVFKEVTAHARKVRLERFETPGAITLVQVSADVIVICKSSRYAHVFADLLGWIDSDVGALPCLANYYLCL